MDIYRIPFITERSNDGTEPTEEERQLRIWAQRIRENINVVRLIKSNDYRKNKQIN